MSYSYSDEESAYSYDISYDGSNEYSFTEPPPTLDELFPSEEEEVNSTPSPPPIVADDDPNIALSLSINKSREMLENTLHMKVKDIKKHHVPGFVILRLEDFSTIRNVTQLGRMIPHLIIGPPPSQEWFNQHPDFFQCYKALILEFPPPPSQ